ncbi:MAG: hypothetical protein AAFQ14_14135 [Cyanobacteria bacterium J06621_12]
MNTRERRATKIGFPIGLYLRQLFSAHTYVRYINPFSFWYRYKIDHLKACYEIDTVEYLENCRRLDCQAVKHTSIGSNIDYADVSMGSLLQQTQLNTIYISQPLIKLRYRGVSYYTKDILNADIHVVAIDPSIVRLNSLRCANNLNNPSTSKKSGSN